MPDAPDAALPAQIGRYRILARLGAGGMGTVYKAHDPQLNRTVAVKVPHFDGPPDKVAARVQRFAREARAAAQVWHPHVCPIFDVGEHEGQPYVVMAFVEGESLAQRLARQGRYEDVAQAATLARQVLDGLGAVHGHGIVHRDLKPGNIMLGADGHPVLMDFGLARPEDAEESLTSEGVVLGTPAYMAPEQASGQSDRVGPWTDVYSLGVVLYQVLTGRLPFDGPPLTVLSRIVHEAPPPPSRLRPDLDPSLEAAVMKALAKEPRERYQAAREMADGLGGWLRSRGLMATTAASPAGISPPAADGGTPTDLPKGGASLTMAANGPTVPRGRRWPRWLAVAGCGALAFILGAGCVIVPLAVYWRMPPSTTRLAGFASGGSSTQAVVMKQASPPHNPALDPELLKAVEKAQRVKTQELLRQGADPNARDAETGEAALMKAAFLGYDPIVQALYSRPEVDVNAKDDKGETALMKAAEAGHESVVRWILQPGTSLTINGQHFPAEIEVNEEDNGGQTALMKAKAKGHTQIVDMLKKAGARE